MTTIRVFQSHYFSSWTCPCETSFHYPDHRFPQSEVNDHFEKECPDPIGGQMAGAGHYDRDLHYEIVTT